MTVTREQAAYLAPIIAACRPSGARHWQQSEITAAIANLGHLGLGDVILAAVRCAQDRNAVSPFAITNMRSPHWQERIGAPISERNPFDPETACDVCERPAEVHREHDGHEFISRLDAMRRREDPTPEQLAERIQTIKADAACHEPAAVSERPKPDPNPKIDALRAELDGAA